MPSQPILYNELICFYEVKMFFDESKAPVYEATVD